MQEVIKQLRKFFKSDVWSTACAEDQPIVSDNGLTGKEGDEVRLDTKINLALDFEGYFNEMAHTYMKWRKQKGLWFDE